MRYRVPSDDELFAMFLMDRELGEKELPYGLGRKTGNELFDEKGRAGPFEYRMQSRTCVMLGLSPEEGELIRLMARMAKKAYFFE